MKMRAGHARTGRMSPRRTNIREKTPFDRRSVRIITDYIKDDAMSQSTTKTDVARRPYADRVAEGDPNCPAAFVTDDEIPWAEIMADFSSKEEMYVFKPADYPSDEAMMGA